MVIIWGSNYSIVKAALAEVPPIAFNGIRLALASTLLLTILAGAKSSNPQITKSSNLIGLLLHPRSGSCR